MTPEEIEKIKRAADADDPQALFAYSRILQETDPKEAYKYVILAAQLGNPYALEAVGDRYLAEGRYDDATRCFKMGARAGILDCSVKLAVIRLEYDESSALRELEDLAEIGIRSACAALAEYYKESGNRKQYAYWRSLIK